MASVATKIFHGDVYLAVYLLALDVCRDLKSEVTNKRQIETQSSVVVVIEFQKPILISSSPVNLIVNYDYYNITNDQ